MITINAHLLKFMNTNQGQSSLVLWSVAMASEQALLTNTNHNHQTSGTDVRSSAAAEGVDMNTDINVIGGEKDDNAEKQDLEVTCNDTAATSPDGGWGWMVCLGSFITNFIVFGIHNSFGVIYSTLVEQLGISSAETGQLSAMLLY